MKSTKYEKGVINKVIKNIFSDINYKILVCFFYILYTFTFKNYNSYTLLFLYILILIYLIKNYQYVLKYLYIILNSKIKYAFLCIIICVIASVFVPYIQQTNDYTYVELITSIFRTGFKYLPLLVMVDKNYKQNLIFDKFLQYFILSSFIYMVSTIIFILFPNLVYIWNDIIYDSSFFQYVNNANYITRYGLCGFSGYQISFKFTLTSVFLIYFIYQKNFLINKNTLIDIVVFILLIIGNSFYGRTGLMIVLLLSLLLIVLLLKNNKQYIKWFCLAIVIMFIAIIILYVFSNKFQVLLNWALNPFFYFFKTGKFYDRSLSIILNKMIFLPKIDTFLIGDGMYTVFNSGVAHYYMSTDVGFMRAILFYGIFFTIIGYLSVFIPLYQMFKDNKKMSFLIFLMIFIFIIFEIKGEIFYRLAPLVVILSIANHISFDKNGGYDGKSKHNNECL